MKLLFNNADNGQKEIKDLLGFLNADIKYKNLETDIELNTVYLIQFIGQAMYDKLFTFYEGTQDGEGASTLKGILKHAQLYVLLLAYLEFTANGDIVHGNSGRKIHFADGEKTPWEWQIKADNGALRRRSYRALDRMIQLLDQSNLTEWTSSEQYKKSKALFLYDAAQFQEAFPISNSAQLYYRLVPFMADVESETLRPTLGGSKYDDLKTKIKGSPTPEEKELIRYCQKITAYRVLQSASLLLPEEMLVDDVNYQVPDRERQTAMDQRRNKFKSMAEDYEIELQRILARQNAVDYQLDPLHGVKPNKNHVNL